MSNCEVCKFFNSCSDMRKRSVMTINTTCPSFTVLGGAINHVDHDTRMERRIYNTMANSLYGANPTRIAKVTIKDEVEISTNDISKYIKNVIFNPPATIILWEDGTKTVVKAQEDDEFDPEVGFTMAVAKKVFGNKGSYYDVVKKWCEPYYEKERAATRKHIDKVIESLGKLAHDQHWFGRPFSVGISKEDLFKPKDADE